MTASRRCNLLASPVAGLTAPVLRCPTTAYRFHYHGQDRGWPCRHRHEDINAAVRCTARLVTAREATR